MIVENQRETFAKALQQAKTVGVLTGAGLSAESGVPTFQDPENGLWQNHNPEEVATYEGFEKDPDNVWQWYRTARQRISSVKPNQGHQVLARLSQRLPNLKLITQNIDGLHQTAGHEGVIEFHGNINENWCSRSGATVSVDNMSDQAPACPNCGHLVRPGVVWYGETINKDLIEQSFDIAKECDLFVTVGTSSMVSPAATLIYHALSENAQFAEINPQPTIFSHKASWTFRLGASQALRDIEKLV